MNVRSSLAWCLGASAVALGCANEAPTGSTDGDHPKTHVVVSVDRSDPASDAPGAASAMARFVSVPAFSDSARVLSAAGASLELPAPDTCQASGSQEDLEPPLPSQGPVDLLEAGDVSIAAAGAVTPLVPHAFPTVGSFASGVLYTTKDRAESALPPGVPYVVSTTGSDVVGSLRLVADAPRSPAGITLAGVPLRDATEVRTGRALDLTWTAGEAPDLVYVELLAYDGSPSVLCTFHDETGAGTIPEGVFAGTGAGRVAVHRLRSRHVETPGSEPSDVHFDFQVGAGLDFGK